MLLLGDWFISDRFANDLWNGPKRCGASQGGPTLCWFPQTILCINIQSEAYLASIQRFSNRKSGRLNIPWRWAGDTRERCGWIKNTWRSFICSRRISDENISLNRYRVNRTTATKIIQRHLSAACREPSRKIWETDLFLEDLRMLYWVDLIDVAPRDK